MLTHLFITLKRETQDMEIFDIKSGKNKESLDSFLRRMLKPLMATDPSSSLPGYYYGLYIMPFEQLCETIPATIMTIVEQYDFHRTQGASHDDILEFIDTHRKSMIAILENLEMSMDNDETNYPDLPNFIEIVLKRESDYSGQFTITQDYVRLVIEETRAFVKENPENTILALQQRMYM